MQEKRLTVPVGSTFCLNIYVKISEIMYYEDELFSEIQIQE